jgi:hypothetical protein
MLPLMHFVVSLQSLVCKLCRKRNHKDIIIYVHPFIHVHVYLLLCVGPYPQGPSDSARHGLKPLISGLCVQNLEQTVLTKENAAILHIIADIKGMMNTIDRVSLFLFPHLGVALVGGMMCYIVATC